LALSWFAKLVYILKKKLSIDEAEEWVKGHFSFADLFFLSLFRLGPWVHSFLVFSLTSFTIYDPNTLYHKNLTGLDASTSPSNV